MQRTPNGDLGRVYRAVTTPSAAGIRWLGWGLVVVLLIGAGCGHRRTTLKNVAGASARIGRVDVEGNSALTDREIEAHMNLQQSRWLPPKRQWFLPGLLPVDRDRVAELYASRGFRGSGGGSSSCCSSGLAAVTAAPR